MFQWDLMGIHQETWVSFFMALNQQTWWFHGDIMRIYTHQNLEYNGKTDMSRWGIEYEYGGDRIVSSYASFGYTLLDPFPQN